MAWQRGAVRSTCVTRELVSLTSTNSDAVHLQEQAGFDYNNIGLWMSQKYCTYVCILVSITLTLLQLT